MAVRNATWTFAEAEAKFSLVVARARTEGPQTITDHGREGVVLVAAEEWKRKTKPVDNLAEFFARSPLRASGLSVSRAKDRPRKPEL